MPFASALMPSIQIGLLSAITALEGFPTVSHYFNLKLASRLGLERYEQLCGHRGHMTGEWLFSVSAFGTEISDDESEFLAAFPKEAEWLRERVGLDTAALRELRHAILPDFIDACCSEFEGTTYDVIGFSSTFQQNVASLALARRIKQRWPHIHIVFGGANMEGDMGVEHARAFTFIDHVVVGEGDITFPTLLQQIRQGNVTPMQGVARREAGDVLFTGQSAPVTDLDKLPTPDYAAYFEQAQQLGLPTVRRLPFEASRGCWWGAKHHCTFCGLNGAGMSYRAKTPARVLAELSELSVRHRLHAFDATDNILNNHFVDDLFDELAARKSDFEFFFEVKANLKREQIRRMYQGGVRRIQPGIESLSTNVLRLMRKGSTMLQNVRVLKWCRHYGIHVNWNLLCGFPGEQAKDYLDTLEVIRCIQHLQPPDGFTRIWLERFSPYFKDCDSYPIHDIRPEASYRFVFPSHVALREIAYFFDYEMDGTAIGDAVFAVEDAVTAWKRAWETSPADTLTFTRLPDGIIVEDRRGGKHVRYDFDGALGLLYEHCGDTARSLSQLIAFLAEFGPTPQADDVRGALETFCSAGLMVRESDGFLAVALPRNRHW
jgi:ribosomal peptide maturation radical SAM protein 1